MSKNWNTIRQIVCFVANGAFTAGFYFLLLFIFLDLCHIYYLYAVNGAFLVAALTQFFINKRITFQSRGSKTRVQLLKYLVLVVLCQGLTNSVVWFAVSYCSLSPYIGIVMSLCVTTPVSFSLSRFWIFKREQKSL